MGRQARFQSSWRLGSTASHLHQMRPFRKPCQRDSRFPGCARH
ncbi:hypothetical protein MC885_001904 [Smutsia gigantea]|nr:hypothetical protein MC885_001904 [Smutsia gigantea]